jgi:aminoglycoside phosphotransferase (APT) family kinase protein
MELLASGRASAVYALDARTVLRRSSFDTEGEVRLMRYLHDSGYPVPEVYEAADGDMVMERLHGETLLAALVAGRLGPEDCAETMLGLLAVLHRIEAPEWLAASARGIDLTGGGERAVLHLDFHPENVLVTEAGPKVIDWTNAAAGDPAIDRAVSWAILAEVDSAAIGPTLATGLDQMLDRVGAGLSAAAHRAGVRFREADPGLTKAELDRSRARLEAVEHNAAMRAIAAE